MQFKKSYIKDRPFWDYCHWIKVNKKATPDAENTAIQ